MYAQVIIDQDAKALDKEFEYRVPTGLNREVGMRVLVPFGSRQLQGFVIGVTEECHYDNTKIKDITASVDDYACIKSELLILMQYMAKKNHLKLASILRLFIPSQMRDGSVHDLFENNYSLSANYKDIKK